MISRFEFKQRRQDVYFRLKQCRKKVGVKNCVINVIMQYFFNTTKNLPS